MPTKKWVQITIFLFAIILFLISTVTGESIDTSGYKWISFATSAIMVLFLVYENWAWKFPIIRKITELSGHPIIHGTWKGTLEYERDTNDQRGSIPFYLSITQTFSTIKIVGYVSTSESFSLVASIIRPMPNKRQLVYLYRSEAPHSDRDENRPHDGTGVLNLIGIPVVQIQGSYYNDRLRRGKIVLNKYSEKISESYQQAECQKYKTIK